VNKKVGESLAAGIENAQQATASTKASLGEWSLSLNCRVEMYV
jgi:hypothetical protein